MNIDGALFELRTHGRRKHLHVARQHQQIAALIGEDSARRRSQSNQIAANYLAQRRLALGGSAQIALGEI
jgi:hypothetical protein